jgi:hypothetical protein
VFPDASGFSMVKISSVDSGVAGSNTRAPARQAIPVRGLNMPSSFQTFGCNFGAGLWASTVPVPFGCERFWHEVDARVQGLAGLHAQWFERQSRCALDGATSRCDHPTRFG